MSVPGVTFGLLNGQQAGASEDDLVALHGEACAAGADPELARQLRVWRRQPGFTLAEGRHGAYLVGFAAGMPLRPSTSWWKDMTSPLPGDLASEHPGRTFAITTLVVRAAWRRQGIGAALHGLILADRPEERATLTVPPGATAAQRALRGWGWTKVARTAAPGGLVLDVLLLSPLHG